MVLQCGNPWLQLPTLTLIQTRQVGFLWHLPALFPSFSSTGCQRNPWHDSLRSRLTVCPTAAGESCGGSVMPTSLQETLGRGSLHISGESGEAWGALRTLWDRRWTPPQGPSWQVVVVVRLKHVKEIERAEQNSRCLWPFSTVIPTIKVFFFSLCSGKQHRVWWRVWEESVGSLCRVQWRNLWTR